MFRLVFQLISASQLGKQPRFSHRERKAASEAATDRQEEKELGRQPEMHADTQEARQTTSQTA